MKWGAGRAPSRGDMLARRASASNTKRSRLEAVGRSPGLTGPGSVLLRIASASIAGYRQHTRSTAILAGRLGSWRHPPGI